jgi:hypothetical protein
MLCKKHFNALATFIVVAGVTLDRLFATEPAAKPLAATFTVTDIANTNGKIAPNASAAAHGGGGAATPSGSAALALMIQVSTTTASFGKDMTTAAKGLSGNSTQPNQNTAEIRIEGVLAWTNTAAAPVVPTARTVTISPISDAVTPDLLATMVLTISDTTFNRGEYTLADGGSGTVTLTSTNAAFQKSASGTLSYYYAAKPWSIAKYELTRGAGAAQANTLTSYHVVPYATFSLPGSSNPTASSGGTGSTAGQLSASGTGAVPPPPVPLNGVAGSTTATGSKNITTGTMSQSASPAIAKLVVAAANSMNQVHVVLRDHATRYDLTNKSLQQGQTFIMIVDEDKDTVLADEFQIVQLPSKTLWPTASKLNVTVQSNDTWYVVNGGTQDLLPGPFEIYDSSKLLVYSGTLSTSLKKSGTDAKATGASSRAVYEAINSGGDLPASAAKMSAGQSSPVKVMIAADESIGLVLGSSSTVTMSGRLMLSSTGPTLPDASPGCFGTAEGTFSVSGTGTPETFNLNTANDQNAVPFGLSFNTASAMSLTTTKACKQSISGVLGAATSELSFYNSQALVTGSGALRIGKSSLQVLDISASDSKKTLVIDALATSVKFKCDSNRPSLIASSSGSLSWSDTATAPASLFSSFYVPIGAIGSDQCEGGSFQLHAATTGGFIASSSSSVPWRLDALGHATVPQWSAPSGSYSLTLRASAGSATSASPTFSGVQASIPFAWSGSESLTLEGTANLSIRGPATAAVSLATTGSTTLAVTGTKTDSARWLFQFAEAGHDLGAYSNDKLLLVPAVSDVTFTEATTASAAVDIAYAKRLVSSHNAMERALKDLAPRQAELDRQQSRLAALQGGRDSDEKRSAIEIVTAKIEQATEKVGRMTGDYERARFRFNRLLGEAEDSARR